MDYFIIAIDGQFIANRYCKTAFTLDEEEALAFTSYEMAAVANTMNGEIIHRHVTQEALAEVPTLTIALFD